MASLRPSFVRGCWAGFHLDPLSWRWVKFGGPRRWGRGPEGGKLVQLWQTSRLCPQESWRHRHHLCSRPSTVYLVMCRRSCWEIFVSDLHPPERRDAVPPRRGRREVRGPFAPAVPQTGAALEALPMRDARWRAGGSLWGALTAVLPFLPPHLPRRCLLAS